MSDIDQGRPEAQRRIEERDERQGDLLLKLLKREAARDAGLDLSNPAHKAFVDDYQGDPDGLADRAKAYGFVSPAEERQQQQADLATQGLERATGAASMQGPGGSGQSGQADERKAKLAEEAQKLKTDVIHRRADRDEILAWAQRAGVPLVGDDQ